MAPSQAPWRPLAEATSRSVTLRSRARSCCACCATRLLSAVSTAASSSCSRPARAVSALFSRTAGCGEAVHTSVRYENASSKKVET